jgi:UDP-N-acetylglucosamine 1-carboxyvinyltransferase
MLSYPSVGATENAILAAVCATGRTVVFGAAREPEIAELCRFLKKAGAKITGIGSRRLVIDGVSALHGVEYTIAGDRIVAGTYLAAAAMTGGELLLRKTDKVCMQGISEVFREAGVQISETKREIFLKAPKCLRAVSKTVTAPFPAFPTDMQSQMAAFFSVAEGESRIYETVFESRFGVVPELRKMQADVFEKDRCVFIHGVKRLYGAEVTASDLRSGAALVLAGLAAEGETKVYEDAYIARGYEDICGTLRKLGARLERREEK